VAAAAASADPSDTIEVPAGNYKLAAGELGVSSTPTNGDTILEGAGARTTTIDAQGNSRVLNVGDGQTTVRGLTLTNGNAPTLTSDPTADSPGDGGAILALAGNTSSTLTLDQIAVTNSTATLNGGGIAAPPENQGVTALTVNRSTISGNTVTGGAVEGLGGGIMAFGDVTVTNSTITGNRAENPGINQGGGLTASLDPTNGVASSTLTLLNTTIAGNTLPTLGQGAGLAIDNPGAGVTSVSAKNTIVAGNAVAGTEADCSLLGLPTSDHNLAGDATCSFDDAGSKEGVDPKLGGLADNGGPTDTLALQEGSPAINAGTDDGCPPIDQRGTTRPQETACDIGAFEFVPPPPPPPKSADLGVTAKAKPKKVKRGKRITFRIVVANAGPDDAEAVTLNGKLPATAKKRVKGASGCTVGAKKSGKRALRCDLGTIASGQSVSLTVKAKAKGKPKRLGAAVQVGSATTDPSPGNEKAKAKVKLKRRH
jgi:hypothetical protein